MGQRSLRTGHRWKQACRLEPSWALGFSVGCFEIRISGVVQMNQVKRAGGLVLVFRGQGTGKPGYWMELSHVY